MAIPYIFVNDQDEKRQRDTMARSINSLIDGKLNVVGTFTLTASSATTVVADNKFESNMVPLFIPTTANAAAALTGLYLSAREQGQFTVTHANNAQVDRTYVYIRLG